MSEEEEKILKEIARTFDDSNIDYGHPIWARATNEGFHEELSDFAASCMVRRSSTGEN
tara:strand:+ start:2673 stop:2846 length:174 start_codon:yes stop_codon:yes gene_type:complete